MSDKSFMNDVRERLNKVVEQSGLTTNAFALRLGVRQATLYKQLTGENSVSLDVVLRVCFHYPDISRDWLLMGEGNMFKSESEVSDTRLIRSLETIALLQETINKRDDMIAMLQARITKLETYINSNNK